MIAYQYLGQCFRNMMMHELALKCFKRQLDLAWYYFAAQHDVYGKYREVRDPSSELDAYDSIGMEYFYLGDLDRARYYHKRMVDSDKEPVSSALRSHRHYFVFKVKMEQYGINFSHTMDIYLRQLSGIYQAPKGSIGGSRVPISTNVLSQTTRKYFTQQKTAPMTPKRSESVTTYNLKQKEQTKALDPVEAQLEKMIILDPSDLSLDDLPSPHSNVENYTFEYASIDNNNSSSSQSLHQRSNSTLRSLKGSRAHFPELIAYINKKHKVNSSPQFSK